MRDRLITLGPAPALLVSAGPEREAETLEWFDRFLSRERDALVQ